MPFILKNGSELTEIWELMSLQSMFKMNTVPFKRKGGEWHNPMTLHFKKGVFIIQLITANQAVHQQIVNFNPL